MIKLRGYRPNDGAGVFEINDRLLYIEFPYTKRHEFACSYDQLERLVNRQGFIPANLDFPDGEAAIKFLRDKASAGENPLSREKNEESLLIRFNFLGVENLRQILAAIERQLDGGEDVEKVDRALNRLLDLEKVQEVPDLFQKARSLWKRCKTELDTMAAIRQQPINYDSSDLQQMFSNAVAAMGADKVSIQAAGNAPKLVA